MNQQCDEFIATIIPHVCAECGQSESHHPLPRPDAAKIDARIVSIEAQIDACMRGATNIITCPYCGAQNKAESEALCCVDFGAVANAILRKQAMGECRDLAMRIADQIANN